MEEACAANKRLKDVIDKQKAAKKMASLGKNIVFHLFDFRLCQISRHCYNNILPVNQVTKWSTKEAPMCAS